MPKTARRGAPATQLNILNDQASPLALIGRREASLALVLVYIRGINPEHFILIKILYKKPAVYLNELVRPASFASGS